MRKYAKKIEKKRVDWDLNWDLKSQHTKRHNGRASYLAICRRICRIMVKFRFHSHFVRFFFFAVVNIDIGNAAGVHRSVIRNALLPSMI